MSEHPPRNSHEHGPETPDHAPQEHAPIATDPVHVTPTPEQASALEAHRQKMGIGEQQAHEPHPASPAPSPAAASKSSRQSFLSIMRDDARYVGAWPLNLRNWVGVFGLIGSWIVQAIKSAPSMAGKGGGGGGGGHGGAHGGGGGGHH